MRAKPVSLRQVSSCDTVAFVARILLVFIWMLLPVVITFVVLSGKVPRESPAEIAFIMLSFSAAFLAVILVRRTKVIKLLGEGKSVDGKIFHYSRYQFFITVGVEFVWKGKTVKRMIQLPAVRATGRIKCMEYVTLGVDPEHYHRLIIKELYTGSEGLEPPLKSYSPDPSM